MREQNRRLENQSVCPNYSTTYTLRQWGQPFFDQFNQEELVTIKEIEVSGNWAFVRLPYTLKLTPKAGGEPFQANGKGLWIFKRQADGTWKASRVIWNGNEPLPVLPEKK